MKGNVSGKSQFEAMTWFMGVVEDINDPLQINRIRARCIGYHTADKTLLPTEALPWAPFLSSTAQMSSPLVNPGDWVVGFFIDGPAAQQPVVLGSMVSIPEAVGDPAQGFYDPSGLFPRLIEEGTNPRHARGVEGEAEYFAADGTTPRSDPVAFSKLSATLDVPVADATKFAEPLSAFAALYPFNHVMQTDAGHTIELDDTPGVERVHVFHKKGSFVEFHPDGTVVYRTATDRYSMVLNNDYCYVKGNMNMSVMGNINILSGLDMNISTQGNVKWRVGGTFSLDVQGGVDINTLGSYNLDVGGYTTQYSGGNMALQAPRIDLNSGTAKPLGEPIPPEVVILEEGGGTTFEVLSFEDDREKDAEELNAVRATAGLPPVSDAIAIVGEEATPEPGGQSKDVQCGSVKAPAGADYSTIQLSPNFTLAKLTQNGSRPLQDQADLTADDILCNLQALCVNILEPIKSAGYTFSINSAFRRPGDVSASSKKSDHYLGKAVDISVSGMSQYKAAVEIYQLVGKISKQFLLEYTTGGGPGWIHIAYDRGGAKSALPMATFNNHKTYAANKLVDLRATEAPEPEPTIDYNGYDGFRFG